MKYRSLLRGFGLASVAILAAACGDAGDPTGVDDGTPKVEIEALPGASVVDRSEDGVPTFLTGDLGRVEVKENPADVDLRPALEVIAPVLHASPEALVLKKAQADNIGDQHFRFRQVKNGREVVGGEIVVHVREGLIYAANGSARDDVDAPVSPKLAVNDAVSAAVVDAQQEHNDDDVAALSQDAQLVYYHGAGRMDLAYRVEVGGTLADDTPVRDSVLVNAVDGKVVARMPHIHSAKNRKVYNSNNGTTTPGALVRSEGGAAVADAIVNNNYDRLGTVYDCYQTLFARDSFDALGGALISSVHYSTNYVNAYWDGTQMVYGDGDNVNSSNLANSLDVTGHELTHAVTEKESNLVYSAESGGLNEAMSDIFGNVCEAFKLGGGTGTLTVDANTWIVGEDVWTPATPNDGLRYMNDPVKDGSSADYWTSTTKNLDVHYSSGVANLAFYLLSQGGTHPRGKSSTVVTGIGIAKAAQIFYRANRDIMTSSTNFAAAKTATEQAAVQLGYTAAEQAAVTAAWVAVGVGAPVVPPTVLTLTDGTASTGLSDVTGGSKYYSLVVPAGKSSLTFTTSGGTGDVDLYVNFGAVPTTSTYTCRPYLTGNAETCTITNPAAGTYYVMLNAYSAYSGLSLLGSTGAGGGGGTGGVVINEVEYDEVGTDSAEFVELYNKSATAVNLSGYSLQFVDGSTKAVYLNVPLTGTLNAGQYLVVGNSTLTPAAGALKINFASGNDKIQNGAPDGVALVNGTTLVDALSYEGSITAAVLSGPGTKTLVEGTALASSTSDSNTVKRSLGRFPNGSDTNVSKTDWSLRTVVTPGAANQ